MGDGISVAIIIFFKSKKNEFFLKKGVATEFPSPFRRRPYKMKPDFSGFILQKFEASGEGEDVVRSATALPPATSPAVPSHRRRSPVPLAAVCHRPLTAGFLEFIEVFFLTKQLEISTNFCNTLLEFHS